MRFILFCFLLPGFGYLQLGRTKHFCASVTLLFITMAFGRIFRLFPTFGGFVTIAVFIFVLHFGTALHAILNRKELRESQNHSGLKTLITGVLLLVTVTSFGNSATIMGFDRVSMAVPVMEPTIRTGEQLLVDTWIYKLQTPQKGDIIIHSFPGQPGIYLNRIIAVGGDRIEMHEGRTFINGVLCPERYVNPKNADSEVSTKMELLTVPSDHYFVMGDNRDRSLGDSRFSGTIDISEIKGKITCILYSKNIARIGIKFE